MNTPKDPRSRTVLRPAAALLFFGSAVLVAVPDAGAQRPPRTSSILSTVIRYIKTDYLEEPDPKKTMDGAFQGLVNVARRPLRLSRQGGRRQIRRSRTGSAQRRRGRSCSSAAAPFPSSSASSREFARRKGRGQDRRLPERPRRPLDARLEPVRDQRSISRTRAGAGQAPRHPGEYDQRDPRRRGRTFIPSR